MFTTLWMAILLSGFQATPQRGQGPVRISIDGVVFRAQAAAGAPDKIAQALVTLTPGNRTTYTSGGGTFYFRDLPAGQYTISVTHDGYILQEDRKRGITTAGMNLRVGVNQTIKDLRLAMIPAPVIVGRVISPDGQPLAAGLVRAYRRQYTPYGTRLRIVRNAMTNDLGDFRLAGLNFGTYFVSAGYGDRDRAVAIGQTRLSANVSRADDGYATIFYDSAEEISLAQATLLAPGAEPGALTIYLRNAARFRIRGQVLPHSGGTRIVLAPRGSDLTQANPFIQPNADGSFELRGVSPGSYLLMASSEDGSRTSDVLPLAISDRDVSDVRLVLAPTTSFTGTISMEGNPRATLAGILVKAVRSSPEFDQSVGTQTNSDGTFTFEHVAPSSEYDITVEPLPAGTYVKSITSGGRDILSGRARLVSNQTLKIVLARAPDTLDVRVTNGSEPGQGILVVLIPSEGLRRRGDRYITGYTGSNGDLSLSGVPPGDYTAYAFERIEQGAYYALVYNAAADNRFRDRAVSVRVGEGGPKTIELRVIAATETQGILQ